MSLASLTKVHQEFEAALPIIIRTAAHAFRKRRPQDREEAVAEARAAAYSAWLGLAKRGKDPVAVGVTGIANNAVRSVKNGRRIGNQHCGRGAMDVHHHRAQKRCAFRVVRLDSIDKFISEPTRGAWIEGLASDPRFSPADEACFRLDFEVWLAGLPSRKRQMADLLALGHETGVVAQLLGVTPGAVSQARIWLARSWHTFQGEVTPIC